MIKSLTMGVVLIFSIALASTSIAIAKTRAEKALLLSCLSALDLTIQENGNIWYTPRPGEGIRTEKCLQKAYRNLSTNPMVNIGQTPGFHVLRDGTIIIE